MPVQEPHIGTEKADFSAIYDQPDPRDYFRALGPLDYQIPQRALPVMEATLDAASAGGHPRTVLDVCCSYGINAGLLRYRTDIDEMTAHYTATGTADENSDEVLAADIEFFGARRRRPELTVFGLDAAPNAISYARNAGLLSDGWAENLEKDEPSREFAAALEGVGMVVCTGGVGYVGAPTFERILAGVASPEDLWLTVFVLRVFDYAEIRQVLDEHGLVTEQLPTTFRQRRFADAHEQQAALEDIAGRGLDPTGKEADGWFHADCYLTRPAAAAAGATLAELLG